jgi:hypothetical protein
MDTRGYSWPDWPRDNYTDIAGKDRPNEAR